MEKHTVIGADMLANLQMYEDEPLMKVAYQICRWHHERYDGKGYPDGLKGEEIPISAQVVALADVYDALTSERVYKKAYSHEEAVQMIATESVVHLTRSCLSACVRFRILLKRSCRRQHTGVR